MSTILWILAAAIVAVAVYFNARCSDDTDSIIEWFDKLYGRKGK
jgi:hypothetical protein